MNALPETLVLGTRNAKKRRELEALVQPLGISVKTLDAFEGVTEVVEDGTTFAENARKKASGYALQLQAWVLGEDSGLMVDALQGAPGIYSARFAGPDATDEQNNELLLVRMADVAPAARQAHYVCHVSLACPRGDIHVDTEEICRGIIRSARAGSHGFGYDPLFEVPEYHRTFGELGAAAKSAISHRGRAMRALVRHLASTFGLGRSAEPCRTDES